MKWKASKGRRWFGWAVRGAAMAAAATGLAAGCTVGNGSGRVQGTLAVPVCDFPDGKTPRGRFFDGMTTEPRLYDLGAVFFVGEPLDSNTPRFPANQMIIRIQSSGERLESANALLFWVFDSAEVARCIRGRVNADGSPDWDPELCDRSPGVLGPSGEGRMFVGMTTENVRSFFVMNKTCPLSYISANALGRCDTVDSSCPDVALCPGRGSWISFNQFGDVPASDDIGAGFSVRDGETIAASAFHVELCDMATVNGVLDRILPIVKPNIVAAFDGFFSFPLARGQAGQPFP